MGNEYPSLCSSQDCTACATCMQSCPKKAIKMLPDEKGFLYPYVDKDICIQCHLCEKKCPILNKERSLNALPKIYACWHRNPIIRMKSSSGGAFSAIAEYVLALKGYVWGVAYTNELRLTYQYVDTMDALDILRRSKYVQAEVGDTFIQIKKQLQQGKTVLFTGTSCHVRGLYAYLPKALCDNLITVDFICHGVPSPKVFKRYIEWIEDRYEDKLIDFNFRDKRYGWDNGVLTVGRFSRIGEKKFVKKENSFFYGMLHDLFIRPCCHQCTSNGLRREADFTIADFWGIGRKEKFEYEAEKYKGVSLLALNSEKAYRIFNSLEEKLLCIQRSLEEAYTYNWNYRYSARINPQTDFFWKKFSQTNSWKDLLCFFRPTFEEQCKWIIKRYMGPIMANKLRKLFSR